MTPMESAIKFAYTQLLYQYEHSDTNTANLKRALQWLRPYLNPSECYKDQRRAFWQSTVEMYYQNVTDEQMESIVDWLMLWDGDNCTGETVSYAVHDLDLDLEELT